MDEKSGQNEIVVIPAASAHITPEDIERSRPLIESASILLLQLEINFDALFRIIEIAHAAGVKHAVITLGALGAFATDGLKHELLPRLNVDAVDTTGAGDAFNGGFVTALSEGRDLFSALRWGNVTNALSVTKPGTASSMPKRSEIEALYEKNYGDLFKLNNKSTGKVIKMNIKKSTFIKTDMLERFICDETYSSIMLMGDELVQEPVINMNQGTLKPHTRLAGGHHDKAEIYYVVNCQEGADLVKQYQSVIMIQ